MTEPLSTITMAPKGKKAAPVSEPSVLTCNDLLTLAGALPPGQGRQHQEGEEPSH